jgi:hypothetical protein
LTLTWRDDGSKLLFQQHKQFLFFCQGELQIETTHVRRSP